MTTTTMQHHTKPSSSLDVAELIGRGLYGLSKVAAYRPGLRDMLWFSIGAACCAGVIFATAPQTPTASQNTPEPVLAPLSVPAPLPDTDEHSLYRPLNLMDPAVALAKMSPIRLSLAPSLAVSPGEQVLRIARGTNLMEMLLESGAEFEEAQNIVDAYKPHVDMRSLKVGQRLKVNFQPDNEGSIVLREATLETRPELQLVAIRNPSGDFSAEEIMLPLHKEVIAVEGEISSSLSQAASKAGVPLKVLNAMIREFSYNVDFQRDIHPSDRFHILYEQFLTPEGKVARNGSMLYAALNLQGRELQIYRYELAGDVAYYDANGTSVRKSFLRTPVDGARISSGFGMRRHPILGYSKMHKGVDFAAPTGTPIFAAGDGVIDYLGRNGSYGNFVRIRHANGYSTAYAHASRFGKGLRRGSKVKQGQIVAYVGTTGRSTGPHLHFEITKSGSLVNPAKVKVLPNNKLTGRHLAQFRAAQRVVQSYFDEQKRKTRTLLARNTHSEEI